MTTLDWESLRQAATEVRKHAHAPYSQFPVGAALIDKQGRVFTGTNIENASFGLSLCAERSAIANAVTAGSRVFSGLVVVTGARAPTTPCGMCRQVLVEFPPSFPVRCYTLAGQLEELTVDALLPHAFAAVDLT